MVLICIFLMVSDVVHFFVYVFSHLYVFFGKTSFQVLCPVLIWVFGVLLLSRMSPLYTLDVNHLLDKQFENIFSHSMGCLFILLMISFAVQMLFSLISSTYLFLLLLLVLFKDTMYKKSLPTPMSRNIFPIFSSRSYMVSVLTFKFLIYFKLIFVSDTR